MQSQVNQDIQAILSEKLRAGIKVIDISPLGGGSINEAGKVSTNQGLFFAKWNDAKLFPRMLELESKGLEILKNSGEIRVPEVVAQGIVNGSQYLILEYMDSSGMKKEFWEDFGRSLARLHKHSAEKFGLDHNNYIGSLQQSNRMHGSWSEFFICERLEPQVRMALDAKRMHVTLSSKFSRLFSRLRNIFPEEKPSLLHGDLWSGNFLSASRGEPCLIDPAVYLGHREMDIGMTRLFGGFPPAFYQTYTGDFPLEGGWRKRTDVCNLYPLMVHVNLFGGNYVNQVENILSRF